MVVSSGHHLCAQAVASARHNARLAFAARKRSTDGIATAAALALTSALATADVAVSGCIGGCNDRSLRLGSIRYEAHLHRVLRTARSAVKGCGRQGSAVEGKARQGKAL